MGERARLLGLCILNEKKTKEVIRVTKNSTGAVLQMLVYRDLKYVFLCF
jgi:hypothetical protein